MITPSEPAVTPAAASPPLCAVDMPGPGPAALLITALSFGILSPEPALTTVPLPTAAPALRTGEAADPNAVPTPTPRPSMRPIDAPDEDEDGPDPNEGCLTDGLFY